MRRKLAPLVGVAFFGLVFMSCGGDTPTAPAPAPTAPAPTPPAQPQPAPPPPAPAGLHVSATTTNSITWTWTAVEGATGYEVQLSADAVFDDTDAIVTTTETSYTATGLSAESGRHLRVRAVAGTVEAPVVGAWSSHVTGMSAMPPPPPAPAGLHVSATTPDSITWTWTAVEGATGYEVQLSADAVFDDTDAIVTTTETSYTATGPSAESGRHLRVRAVAGSAEAPVVSAWSSHVTGMSAMPPPPPTAPAVPVCDRTSQVRDAILAELSMTDCSAVTNERLRTIWELNLESKSLTALQSGDFSGMSGLAYLSLQNNALTSLPDDVFAGLNSLDGVRLEHNTLTSLPEGAFADSTSLSWLRLDNNALTALPEDLFAGLGSLSELILDDNMLTSLPAGIFAGLSSLERLRLVNNALTALPASVFRGLERLRILRLDFNPLTTESFPPGIFVGLSSLEEVGTSATERAETTVVFPLMIEEISRLGAEIHLRLVIPQGAPGPLQIRLRTAGRVEASETIVTIDSGETHSEEFVLATTGQGWQFTAAWDWKSRYPQVVVSFPTGFGIATATLDSPAGARSSRDRPDDITGPQIHVVYATVADGEDQELDRNGSIESSFEIIQEWLEADIGRTLRLDTYDGELDVTHLQIDEADIPSQGEELRRQHYFAHIRSLLPRSPSKAYAVFLDTYEAGNVGGAGGDGTALVFLEGRRPAAGVQRIGPSERTMLHEIVHALGGVEDCAPNSTNRFEALRNECFAQGHVVDDPFDLMGVVVELEEGSVVSFPGNSRDGTILDADRDDYVGHGRPDCFDLLTSPFLE